MRITRPLATIVAVLALASTAACGNDESEGAGTVPSSSAADPTAGETDPISGGLTDVCTEITEAEIADIVGASVAREDIPGGGCSFSQEDLRAPTLSFSTSTFDEANGGFDGAASGISGALQNSSGAEVAGIGEKAYVATGTSPGGSNTQCSGVVLVGDSLVQVTLIQGNGLSASAVKALVVDALTLAASKG